MTDDRPADPPPLDSSALPSSELGAEPMLPSESERLRRIARRAPPPGRYRQDGELARGGMGAILRVWDEDLQRPLAMKVILGTEQAAAASTPPVDRVLLERFLEEAQVTAQLDHPSVVPVHELGLDERGRVYFTMKLVEGTDLGTVFDRHHAGDPEWSLSRCVGLLVRACEALAFAHDKGVIHRDLKPPNIMVGRYGEVYVMDWGLARAAGREPRDPEASAAPSADPAGSGSRGSPALTQDGAALGTPHFMAPEQAEGRQQDVGPRSDLYSMGALLYHLLSGRMPYQPSQGRRTAAETLAEALRGPPAPLARLAPDAPPPLVAICEKAMARDPAARYATAAELAEDLRSWSELRVVRAYRTGSLAELSTWIARNRGMAASLAALLLLLVGGSAWIAVAERARTGSEQRLRESEQRRGAELAEAAGVLSRTLAASDSLRAQQLAAEGQHAAAVAFLARAIQEDPDHRVSRVHLASMLLDQRWPELEATYYHSGPIAAMDFSPDGTRLATSSDSESYTLWDLEERRAINGTAFSSFLMEGSCPSFLRIHPDGEEVLGVGQGRALVWSTTPREVPVPPSVSRPALQALRSFVQEDMPEGAPYAAEAPFAQKLRERMLAGEGPGAIAYCEARDWLASADDEGRLELIDLASLRPLSQGWRHGHAVLDLAFDAEGRSLRSVGAEGRIVRWSLPAGSVEEVVELGRPLTQAQFSRDGDAIAASCDDGSLLHRFLDDDEPTTTRIFPLTRRLHRLVLSPDGLTLALAFPSAPSVLWPVDAPAPRELAEGIGDVRLQFTEDGRWLLGCQSDGRARLWDVARAAKIADFHPGQAVECAAVDPTHRRLALASNYGVVRVWRLPDPARPDDRRRLDLGSPIVQHAFDREGTRLLLGTEDGRCRIVGVEDARLQAEGPRLPGEIQGVQWSDDGRRALAFGRTRVVVWEVASGRIELERNTEAEFVGALLDPSGARAVISEESGRATVCLLDEGRSFFFDTSILLSTWELGVAPDGSSLVVTDVGGATLYDPASGRKLSVLAPLHVVELPRWSPDSAMLYLASGQEAWGYEVATGEKRTRSVAHPADLWCMALSPDGRLLATGCARGRIRTWTADEGRAQSPFFGHDTAVSSLQFSTDADLLLSTSFGGEARLWDARSGLPLGPPIAGARSWAQASLSPDSRTLFLADEAGEIRLRRLAGYDALDEESRIALVQAAREIAGVVLGDDNVPALLPAPPVGGDSRARARAILLDRD